MGSFQKNANLISHSPENTQSLGESIGQLSYPGYVVLLIGELGSGKTCLTQGIARGLGISEYVSSPTFVLVREYHGRLPLFHIDLYRLQLMPEVADLGMEDYLYGKGLCVVEWADRAMQLMPEDNLTITFGCRYDTDRDISIAAHGERHCLLLHQIKSRWKDR